jgi:hypothetical protein
LNDIDALNVVQLDDRLQSEVRDGAEPADADFLAANSAGVRISALTIRDWIAYGTVVATSTTSPPCKMFETSGGPPSRAHTRLTAEHRLNDNR